MNAVETLADTGVECAGCGETIFPGQSCPWCGSDETLELDTGLDPTGMPRICNGCFTNRASSGWCPEPGCQAKRVRAEAFRVTDAANERPGPDRLTRLLDQGHGYREAARDEDRYV